MKYNENSVIGLTIYTDDGKNPLHKYKVVDEYLLRIHTNEKISYNHSSTANQLNNGYWKVGQSKIHELW